MITGADICPGDVLVGLASSGVHSNGFSLVRKVFALDGPEAAENLEVFYEELGEELGDALLRPTKIYVKALRAIREAGVRVKGCSHITGGGFYENVPRMLPDGVTAKIRKDSYPMLPIFPLIQRTGEIAEQMMYNTFNMGIGMVLAVREADVKSVLAAAQEAGEQAYVIGEVTASANPEEKGVVLC